MERTHLVSCEHASCAVPAGVELGVDPEILASHVGWDAGAAPVAVALATALGVAPILGACSRLVADLNRPETSAAAVPTTAFGTAVPGNVAVDREARLAQYHRPYWDRVVAAIEAALAAGPCLHLSVHSFSADYRSAEAARDFDVGLLYDPAFPDEATLVARIERSLTARGLRVRHNQPYAGVDEGLVQTLRHRYAERAYTGIEIELSQGTVAASEQPDPRIIDGLRTALGG